MTDTTVLILVAGCAVFAVTTLAALWTGYLLMQQRWVTENPGLTFEDDEIRPLFAGVYLQQVGRYRDASTEVADTWAQMTRPPIDIGIDQPDREATAVGRSRLLREQTGRQHLRPSRMIDRHVEQRVIATAEGPARRPCDDGRSASLASTNERSCRRSEVAEPSRWRTIGRRAVAVVNAAWGM
ncbi:MAG: hypothetical protein AAF657_00365 [Acidobacteriota bacterium]